MSWRTVPETKTPWPSWGWTIAVNSTKLISVTLRKTWFKSSSDLHHDLRHDFLYLIIILNRSFTPMDVAPNMILNNRINLLEPRSNLQQLPIPVGALVLFNTSVNNKTIKLTRFQQSYWIHWTTWHRIIPLITLFLELSLYFDVVKFHDLSPWSSQTTCCIPLTMTPGQHSIYYGVDHGVDNH